MSIDSLIQKYPNFHYSNFHWIKTNDKKIQFSFEFEIEGLTKFTPTTELTLPILIQDKLDDACINNFIFHIGLVEMISYWKATCSPNLQIHCGFLNTEQIAFWEDLIFKGLGEFRFLNQINISKQKFVKIKIINDVDKKPIAISNKKLDENVLIPIGGGKDSVVTLELLSQKYSNAYVYMLNPINSAIQICDLAGIQKENVVSAKRVIDAELLKLNTNGFLNGHTPFSALISFQTALISYLLNLRYVALSNENSANEGNIDWAGSVVNHQYSKTYEYELSFRIYSQKFLSSNFEYFSFLRPLKELHIAKIFSQYRKYHKTFRSCNKGQKKGIWCCNCAKCLFVWVMLAPFKSTSELIDIFGENLWANKDLEETLKELSGISGHKPFECVGTTSEVKTALALTIQNNNDIDKNNLLLKKAKLWQLNCSDIKMIPEHKLPQHFLEILTHAST